MPRYRDPQDYIDSLTDPQEWYKTADGLANSSHTLWSDAWQAIQSITEDSQNTNTEDPEDSEETDIRATRAGWHMNTALMLVGFGLENALKGTLIEENPEETEIMTKMDGEKNLIEAKINKLAGISPSHDLHKLSEKANLFDADRNPIIDEPQDLKRFDQILGHLTHSIRWMSRYPVPLDFDEQRRWFQDTPTDTENPVDAIFFYMDTFRASVDLIDHLTPGENTHAWPEDLH